MTLATIEWAQVESGLHAHGHASLGTLLSASECREIVRMYGDESRFRSKIEMRRYRFGVGEYQYFDYPLPPLVARLRAALYEALAPIANPWMNLLKSELRFPESHAGFVEQCHSQDQTRPTPLLLQYPAGGYNCLHQDLYGAIYFPFQVIVQLSRPGVDFTGGELMLVEQLPRAQSVGHVLNPRQGEATVITTRHRPVQGSKGIYRANVRHGVSRIHTGERWTLGMIFHDAQ